MKGFILVFGLGVSLIILSIGINLFRPNKVGFLMGLVFFSIISLILFGSNYYFFGDLEMALNSAIQLFYVLVPVSLFFLFMNEITNETDKKTEKFEIQKDKNEP